MSQDVNGKVAVSVTKYGEKILLMKRSEETSSSGLWALPGGKIKEDEKASEAVLRELEEETGLKGQIINKGESCRDGGELGSWRLFPFIVEVKNNEVELNHEHSEYRWVEKQEVEKFDTLGELKALQILDSS